jgi:phosphopantetheine--protein transferase-like protein
MTDTWVHASLEASTSVADLAGRYLSQDERSDFDELTGRGRVPWLLGRVAAKDAVRRHLAERGFAEIHPARIVVGNDANGCPTVRVRAARVATRRLRISIAHKSTIAVAAADSLPRAPARPSGGPRPAHGIGIDIEAVEARSATFEKTVLTPAERLLSGRAADARDEWLTRVWAVKEAAAKATGYGLRGRPKDFEIDLVHGDQFRCCGRWIATRDLSQAGGRFVVAWTDTF